MLMNAEKNVEKNVLMEVEKDLNWKEMIVVKIFSKTTMKIYQKGLVDSFNYFNKN